MANKIRGRIIKLFAMLVTLSCAILIGWYSSIYFLGDITSNKYVFIPISIFTLICFLTSSSVAIYFSRYFWIAGLFVLLPGVLAFLPTIVLLATSNSLIYCLLFVIWLVGIIYIACYIGDKFGREKPSFAQPLSLAIVISILKTLEIQLI